jgi:hypothetical protein
MSMEPRGPGWWRASDGRWYPPQSQPAYPPQQRPAYPPQPRPAYPPQPFGAGPPAPQKKRGNHGVLIAVLIVVAVVLVAGALGAYFLFRAVSNSVSDVVGGGELNCPSAEDISALVGSEVNGPTGGNIVVASGCYYLPKGPDDVIEVIIVSGSKLIADDEIASFENEGRAANADVRSIEVGDRGRAWASPTKSAAIAVGDQSLVSVEVQGKDFTTIPDKTEAAIAILEKVLH